MATATTVESTPEELLRITDRPMPELVHGQLMERPPMGQQADAIAARLARWVGNFAEERGLGIVNGSQCGYQIFPHEPSRVRLPDASFTRTERLRGERPAVGHSRIVPDIVIEVVSPNDGVYELEEKLADFQAAGVPLVWVAYPPTREVEVRRADGSVNRLRAGDAIDGEDILPGFRVEVAKLFEGLA